LTTETALLAIKEQSEQELQQQLENIQIKVSQETQRLQEQIRKTLQFNQATKKVEPLEQTYTYNSTNSKLENANLLSYSNLEPLSTTVEKAIPIDIF
jgi:vacuolar-type H+-ATPase subunit E/Vma4